MKTSTLLRWSLGAFTLAVAYVWSLPWLAANGYAEQLDPDDISVSRYIDNTHANGAFAMSLGPLITLQWVDLVNIAKQPRDIRAFYISIVALMVSQIGFAAVVGFDADYDVSIHIYAWVLMALSLVIYYICIMRAAPRVRLRWPLYAVLLAIVGLFAAIVYEMVAWPNQGTVFFYTEASMLTAIAMFTPLRLYLSR